jgi:hypothetical protein
MALKTKPNYDEFELSLFGPGVGECIVVHLGANEWIIVDSCKGERSPAAIEYLESLNVSLAEEVKLVVATHWHNDHIRGLDTILSKCSLASFFASRALFSEEFLAFAELWDEVDRERSAVSEFYKIIKRFEALGAAADGRIKYAGPNRRMRRRQHEFGRARFTSELFSLSPSDHEIARSYESIRALMPSAGQRPRKPSRFSRNDTSVVLSIQSGHANVLLGADLETSAHQDSGWRVIVNSNERPQGLASVFKIPHHGSQTGDDPEVWKRMLIPDPLALVTPYKSGKRPLPQPRDIERICRYTKNAYITAAPRQKSRRSRSGVVGKMIYENVKRIWMVDDSVSQIRLRRNITDRDGKWEILLSGEAMPLDRAA